MAKIKALRFVVHSVVEESFSIYIDWDNDRHQAVDVTSRNPSDVIHGLERLTALVYNDTAAGEI